MHQRESRGASCQPASRSSGSHLGKEVPENRNRFFFHLNSSKRSTAGSDKRQRQNKRRRMGIGCAQRRRGRQREREREKIMWTPPNPTSTLIHSVGLENANASRPFTNTQQVFIKSIHKSYKWNSMQPTQPVLLRFLAALVMHLSLTHDPNNKSLKRKHILNIMCLYLFVNLSCSIDDLFMGTVSRLKTD